MNYKTELDIKTILYKVDNTLDKIEVKGESVEFLYTVRKTIKQLFEGIEAVLEENEEIIKEE